MKKTKLHFIDLFAGCGGLSLGLEQAGFTPVYVNELNKDAMDSYLCNRIDDNPLLEKYQSYDIKELSEKTDIKKLINDISKDYKIKDKKFPIDLVVGGPPCQGYSMIGHRRSYSVNKNKLISNYLYKDMAKVIEKIKPKIFLFENVRGLMSARWTKKGKTGEIWDDVKKTFQKQTGDYYVKDILIFSKDYGVPQRRPRVFIIGVHKSLKFEKKDTHIASGLFPRPVPDSHPHLIDLLSDLIDKDYKKEYLTKKYPSIPKNDIQKSFRKDKRNKNLHELTDHNYSKHTPNVEKKFKYMILNNIDHTAGKEILPKEFRTKKFRQKLLPKIWDKDGPNLTITSLPDDFVHFSQPRSLTVREWARIQTFPDWYEFKGPRTTGGLRRAGNPKKNDFKRELPKYTQIGNAVPVKLSFEIGKHFSNIIKKYNGNNK